MQDKHQTLSQNLQFSFSQDSVLASTQNSCSSSNALPSKPFPNFTKTSKNNSFNPYATITPITRNIKINDNCYAIYSTLHKIPLSVHQFLDKSIVEGTATREGMDFYPQPNLIDEADGKFFVDSSYYEKTIAYKNLHYDKGHMAPAKNYCGNEQYMRSTYTYANCIPQNSYFNRGSWKNLESYCRKFVRQDICETIEIISGPVFYSNLPYIVKGTQMPNTYENKQVVILENGIVVPPKCYKIIKANVGDTSYMSAFVLDNVYKKDNDEVLKSKVVELQQLEIMTGLRFNLGKCKSLQELDPVGMSKTMGDLHLQFYTKLYKMAKNLGQMSGARKQGLSYFVKVDINCIPKQQRLKIAYKDIQITLKQVGWTRFNARSRRKINTLLSIHKDAYDLEIINQDLTNKIIQGIQQNMEEAKAEKDKQYHKYIASKLYGKRYQQYQYPLEEDLRKIFENVAEKDEKQKKQGDNENENEESNRQMIIQQQKQEKQKQKKVKKPKNTPQTDKTEKKESGKKEQSSKKKYEEKEKEKENGEDKKKGTRSKKKQGTQSAKKEDLPDKDDEQTAVIEEQKSKPEQQVLKQQNKQE